LAESNEKIGMVGVKLLFMRARELYNLWESKVIVNLSLKTHIAMFEMDNLSWNKKYRDKLFYYFILSASLLVKNNIFKKIGLLDEKYFIMSEEKDWCIRTLLAGYKLFSCGRGKVWHKGSTVASSRNVEKELFRQKSISCLWGNFLISGYYLVRNKIYFTKKNFPESFYKYCLIQLPYIILQIILDIDLR